MVQEDPIARKKALEQQIEQLQKEVHDIQSTHKKKILSKIVEYMVEFDISAGEVHGALNQRLGISRNVSRKSIGPSPVKYRHPKTGQAWSGRGRAPRWLVEEEESGKSRDDFLVDGDRQGALA